MVDFRQTGYGAPAQSGAGVASFDLGLRNYMLGVYNYMAIGLLVTAAAAYGIYSAAFTASGYPTQFGYTLFATPLHWVVMLAPLAFVMVLSFGINRLSSGTAQMLFWGFAAVMGVSLSTIFAAYAHGSIARVFLITAGMFGATSLYGYTTKRDLTGMGSFLMMGLFGLIIASLVNLFMQSPGIAWAVSILGVVIFAGLAAYDTQKIKSMYYEGDDSEIAGKKRVMGALTLYLDFINMFLMLLRLMGNQRN